MFSAISAFKVLIGLRHEKPQNAKVAENGRGGN
jgi:hypothetical protein